MKKKLAVCALSGLLGLGTLAGYECAFASDVGYFVYDSTYDHTGLGFGTQINLLTLQAPSSETGSVYWTGTASDWTGDAKKNETQAQSLGKFNTLSGLTLILNAAENDTTITIGATTVILYNASGGVNCTLGLDFASYPQEITLVNKGVGGGDVAFTLNDDAVKYIESINSWQSLYLGMTSTLTGTSDGPDTWILTQKVSAVPVPSSALLLGSSILGLVGFASRRRS
nr:hypothetical protein [uncultured Desulfobulbus sp.]